MEYLSIIVPIIGGTVGVINFFINQDIGDKLKHFIYIGIITVILYFATDLYIKNNEFNSTPKRASKLLDNYEQSSKIAFITNALNIIKLNNDKDSEIYKRAEILRNKARIHSQFKENKQIEEIAKEVKSMLEVIK